MTTTNIPEIGGFPQDNSNRSLSSMALEIVGFSGGRARADLNDRAKESLRQAVREFNALKWTFNRVVEDITLSEPAADTVGEYDLANDFRNPIRAQLVDADNFTQESLCWIDWREWSYFLADQSTTTSSPQYYTARNIHEVGRLIIDAPAAATLTWPTLRVFYHRRIVNPTADNAVWNVPTEVEEAMFQRATALFLAKVKSFQDARDATLQASILKAQIEFEYRDWEDF